VLLVTGPAAAPTLPLAAATFILINVRSSVVGFLEAERADPPLTEQQLPQLSQ
jgi:hypothetical protein